MKSNSKSILIGSAITLLILILAILILYNNSNNKNKSNSLPINNKVIVYMFHGSGCPHCQKAIKEMQDNKNTIYKNMEIRTFEVWNNKDNSQLLQKVGEKLNVKIKYVPYFVIGTYNEDGFDGQKLVKEYEKAVKSSKYEDIVEKVIAENPDLNITYETI